MYIKEQSKKLQKFLDEFSPVFKLKSTADDGSNIKLTLKSSSLSAVAFNDYFTVYNKIEDPVCGSDFSVLFDYVSVTDYLKKLDCEVEINFNQSSGEDGKSNNNFIIKHEKGQATFPWKCVDSFPELMRPNGSEHLFDVDCQSIVNIIQKIKPFFLDYKKKHSWAQYICLDHCFDNSINVAYTDGHRIIIDNIDSDVKKIGETIFHYSFVDFFVNYFNNKTGVISFFSDGKRTYMRLGSIYIYVLEHDLKYANYKNIYDSMERYIDSEFIIDSDEVIQSLKRLSFEDLCTAVLSFDGDDYISISSKSQMVYDAKESIQSEIKKSGDLDAMINVKYMIDCIRYMDDSNIAVSCVYENKGLLFKSRKNENKKIYLLCYKN